MKVTKEMKKAKAIELLNELKIYKPYIDGFTEEDKVCFFERYAGFWVYQEPRVEHKIREIEKKYNCLVYAITHEYTNFGECWDFLIVTDYKSEWKNLVRKSGNDRIAFAYVWNNTYESDSELGSIVIKSFGGGIARVG